MELASARARSKAGWSEEVEDMRRFTLVAIAASVLLGFAALGAAQSSQPPSELKFVDGHWTAWDPPASIAEGAQVHVIQPGDTLWDLSARFLADPYLWPQIWERNQYILDAHWIYPGDPLVLGFEVETEAAEVLAEPGAGEQEGEAGEQTADDEGAGGPDGRRANPFVQLGTPDDIYCSGYIGEIDEQFPFTIIGSEYEVLGPEVNIDKIRRLKVTFGDAAAIKVGLDDGDIVYLDGGQEGGLGPGDEFTVVEPLDVVNHPVTDRRVGRFYRYVGRVRVLSVQAETAIAEISEACDAIRIGSTLKPFVPEPIPSERRTELRPVNEPVAAASLRQAPTILRAKDQVVSLGEDHVVFLELGETDGVEPGDIFTVYRYADADRPPVVLGEVAVLSVHPLSSVAKIVESRYPIYVGDRLDRK
jgi:hypothetical protein